jgi:outer membrane protein TolC
LTVIVMLALLPALSSSAEADDDGRRVHRLSLRDCFLIALDNNLDLIWARKGPETETQRVLAQEAAFDFVLSGGATHREAKQEISNLFSLNEYESDGASVGVSQNLKFGGNYSVELTGGRSIQSGPLVSVPSNYGSDLAMSFNLPLLDGFGKEAATINLELARGNLEISENDLKEQAESIMLSVEEAYWNLVAFEEALQVARQSLQRAQDQLDLNRKKVEVGTLAPIEITLAEAGVANQVEGLIQAETNLVNAMDTLRSYLSVPETSTMWDEIIEPTDKPDFEPVSVELDAAIEAALTNRPDVASSRRLLQNAELNERVARRSLRPSLDLQFRVTPSGNNFETILDPGPDGILGTPDDPPAVTNITGKLSEAISEIPDFNNYDWSVGVGFAMPFGNRADKANYAAARISRERAELVVEGQELGIRVEVRAAVRGIESGVKRVDAARANVVLQRKKLEAEQKKFENGMSTSFEVLEYQNDLASAELSEIQARLDYIKALAALEKAKGTLLESRNLTLGD